MASDGLVGSSDATSVSSSAPLVFLFSLLVTALSYLSVVEVEAGTEAPRCFMVPSWGEPRRIKNLVDLGGMQFAHCEHA